MFNKTFNSLSTENKSLIERYSTVYSPNFDLTNYFYENKFSEEKIDEIIDLSKRELINEVNQNLNDPQELLLKSTFKSEYDLVKFMVKNEYSMNKLIAELEIKYNQKYIELDNSLDSKQKFLLKKYFSKSDDYDIVRHLIEHRYNLYKSSEIAKEYKKELSDNFNNNLNEDYEKILYNKFYSTKINSKNELLDYLIYEGYTVESMKELIKSDVYRNFKIILNDYTCSLLYFKFKLGFETNKELLYKYLFDNNYTIDDILKAINQAKIELHDELTMKINIETVYKLTQKLEIQRSKDNLISHLEENCTVDLIRELLKENNIEL